MRQEDTGFLEIVVRRRHAPSEISEVVNRWGQGAVQLLAHPDHVEFHSPDTGDVCTAAEASIRLTPGAISIEIDGRQFTVARSALTGAGKFEE